MGLTSGVTEEEFNAWLESSCVESGVGTSVSDPEVLSRIGRLIGGQEGTDRAQGAPAPSTDRTRLAS